MSNPLTPSDLLVYKQPGRDATKWKYRGVTRVFGYEPEADPTGHPTVSVAAWDASYNTAGILRIREPAANDYVGGNGGLIGHLFDHDEPDNLVVTILADNPAKNGLALEAFYRGIEDWFADHVLRYPGFEVWMNFGLEQIQWKIPGTSTPKVDYPRLLRCCHRASVDWYAVHRGRPVSDYGTLIDTFRALPGGDKLAVAFCECSFQNLDPAAYPNQRCPTAAEFTATLNLVKSRGLTPGLFPQRMGNDPTPTRPKTDFSYDAMPSEIVAALADWRAKNPAPGPAPAPVPVTPQPAPQPTPAPPASLESRVAKLEADRDTQAAAIATLQLAAFPPPAAPAQPNVRKPKKPN